MSNIMREDGDVPEVNPGVRTSFGVQQQLDKTNAEFDANQIRGVNSANSTGYGVPNQVTNVSVNQANATTGSTTTITITFRRDPSDHTFQGVVVYVKGYEQNPSWVQIAATADSPAQFILTNTGEAVSFAVQAFGNAGYAPLSSAPTVGLKLPTATSGGSGTTTTTTTALGPGTTGALVKWATTTTIAAGDLSGDVTTSGSLVTTIAKLSGNTLGTFVPVPGDVLMEDLNSKWNPQAALGCGGVISRCLLGSSTPSTYPAVGDGGVGSASVFLAGTATEPPMLQKKTTAAGSTNCTIGVQLHTTSALTNHPCLGTIRRFFTRIRCDGTTNMRLWVGLCDTSVITSTTLSSDTPAVNFIGFRFSSTTDGTTWACITNTDGTHQQKQDSGVAVDTTNSQLLEVVYRDSTHVEFYINNVLVKTNTSNIPATSVHMCCTAVGDNKNQATAIAFSMAFMGMTTK